MFLAKKKAPTPIGAILKKTKLTIKISKYYCNGICTTRNL